MLRSTLFVGTVLQVETMYDSLLYIEYVVALMVPLLTIVQLFNDVVYSYDYNFNVTYGYYRDHRYNVI